ncbi:DUF4269 domain-containing protein [uncultured Hymenobacter sp.]|uniref:DUF4269 domain-containing protein n=1 Tax=uncultured Hymenobacter sp. TaxID=170016 RepID=UPI0035CB21C7
MAGTPRQRAAYHALRRLGIWLTLGAFQPVLVGTIPLGIDIATSDLDVICAVHPDQLPQFERLLRQHYGRLPGFQLARATGRTQDSLVSNFRFGGFEIEVFGQDLPTDQQNAFRHLVVEQALLQAGGAAWRQAVRGLKQRGLKTEPAFAQLLGLTGNPYEALLTLENHTPAELAARLAGLPLPSSLF